MAIFLRGNEVYEATVKRLQNDIEIVGATITRSGGRVTKIEFGGGGGGGTSTLSSPDGSAWALSVNNLGAITTTKI